MGTNFSNPENQTHKHMIPIIHTNTQTQTHKHVHPHNKSKNFFSKHKQNPKVRNEREERGGEEGWNRSCMSFPAFLIGAAGSWWRRSAPLLPVGGDLASSVLVEISAWWISFVGDQRCLDSVRGKEWRGKDGFVLVCLGIGGEWWKKKGEKGIYGEREDTRGYGNHEPNIVLK